VIGEVVVPGGDIVAAPHAVKNSAARNFRMRA
jgi:hypothetical protein